MRVFGSTGIGRTPFLVIGNSLFILASKFGALFLPMSLWSVRQLLCEATALFQGGETPSHPEVSLRLGISSAQSNVKGLCGESTSEPSLSFIVSTGRFLCSGGCVDCNTLLVDLYAVSAHEGPLAKGKRLII